MSLPIFIPSRSRPGRLHALDQFTDEMLGRTTIVVPRSQHNMYESRLAAEWDPPVPLVQSVPDEFRIGETRLEIGRMASRWGCPRFLMVDDDIQFLVRQSPDSWRLRLARMPEVEEMLTHLEGVMTRAPHIRLASVSPREGNNRVGQGPPEAEHMLELCQRIHRVYLWDTEWYLSLEHLRVPVAEDFDLALQTLRRGSLTAMTYYWSQGQKRTGDEGGCSDYRSVEFHNQAIRRLQELHPGYVQVYQKVAAPSSKNPMDSRLEARISWQAAAGL